MPGHSNAALVSYPELRCERMAPPPFTSIGGPPNNLCTDRDSVYTFVSDVVREISAAAPTPYFHIGGDEVQKLTKEQYRAFVERVEAIVTSLGPRMIGWGEIATANLKPTTIVQHWNPDSAVLHAARGGTIILSPGPHAYLDMKYDSTTVLGLKWAGFIDLRRAYDWDPATLIPGVGEASILGVEGAAVGGDARDAAGLRVSGISATGRAGRSRLVEPGRSELGGFSAPHWGAWRAAGGSGSELCAGAGCELELVTTLEPTLQSQRLLCSAT